MIRFDCDGDDYDDDFEGCNNKKTKHSVSIRDNAVSCMEVFFCDKEYWAGGPIPHSKLYTKEYIDAVVNICVFDALAIFNYCIEKNPPDVPDVERWREKLICDCHYQCSRRLISKDHAGGMLLVYLSLCYGIDFIPTYKKLTEIRELFLQREELEELKGNDEL